MDAIQSSAFRLMIVMMTVIIEMTMKSRGIWGNRQFFGLISSVLFWLHSTEHLWNFVYDFQNGTTHCGVRRTVPEAKRREKKMHVTHSVRCVATRISTARQRKRPNPKKNNMKRTAPARECIWPLIDVRVCVFMRCRHSRVSMCAWNGFRNCCARSNETICFGV